MDVGAVLLEVRNRLMACSQANPRSTTQRCLPRPELCVTPRRAIRGVMPPGLWHPAQSLRQP
jgi:hypothetical protein